jgi:ATP-dependent Clp protease adaptor protein ClpS
MTEMATDIKTLTKEKIKLDEPGLYDVIFLNDSITTMEFVVKVLKQIFNKTPEQAQNITMRIHQDGQGIVGSYTHEVAEQKGIEATLAATSGELPTYRSRSRNSKDATQGLRAGESEDHPSGAGPNAR